MRGWASLSTPTRWRSSWRSRPPCRTPSRHTTAGTRTARSRWPWKPYTGPPGRRAGPDQKERGRAAEEKGEAPRQLTPARELEGVRMSPRARQAKSKARVASYEALLAEEREREQGGGEVLMPA